MFAIKNLCAFLLQESRFLVDCVCQKRFTTLLYVPRNTIGPSSLFFSSRRIHNSNAKSPHSRMNTNKNPEDRKIILKYKLELVEHYFDLMCVEKCFWHSETVLHDIFRNLFIVRFFSQTVSGIFENFKIKKWTFSLRILVLHF